MRHPDCPTLCEPWAYRGALPPHPRPSLRRWGIRTGHLLARAGRALPRNPRGGKGSLRSALWADPCRPGGPGVAQRVPDRGDDLTSCHWRAINPGQRRAGAVTTRHVKWQLRHDDGLFRSDSQADSAGSIPVTRSYVKAQVRDVPPAWALIVLRACWSSCLRWVQA
jgi:hypothetical protein